MAKVLIRLLSICILNKAWLGSVAVGLVLRQSLRMSNRLHIVDSTTDLCVLRTVLHSWILSPEFTRVAYDLGGSQRGLFFQSKDIA